MTPMTPARLASALAVRLQVERDAAVARTKQMEADLVEANGVIQRVMRDREMWQARAEANVEVVELTPRRKELADAQTALAAMTTERDVLRELLNVYNVGGWTDAVAPMQRALKAETERDEADTALAACQSQAAAKIDQLERDCHALKRAIGPVSAGPEPWEGMPPTSFYVAVADRRREMSLKVRPADAVSRLHNLADSFETCDDCEQSACDDAKTDGPHVLAALTHGPTLSGSHAQLVGRRLVLDAHAAVISLGRGLTIRTPGPSHESLPTPLSAPGSLGSSSAARVARRRGPAMSRGFDQWSSSARRLARLCSSSNSAFLNLCFAAWKRDVEYTTLWGSLNLILCAWLYRRVVIGDAGKGLSRSTKLDADQFRRCLMSLSAEPDYTDFLVGRRITDRDRSPAYNRLKTIFARRYWDEHKQKLLLPQPSWAHASGKDRR